MPNRIYVKQPDSQEIDRLMDRKPATRQPENRPSDSRKTDRQMAGKPAPNKANNSNLRNNLRNNLSFAGCIANALMEQEVAVRMTNFALILKT